MRSRTIGAALAAALAAHPAAAQIRGAASCDPVRVINEKRSLAGADHLERMHPLIARGRYASLAEAGRWSDAMLALRNDAAQAFVEGGVGSSESGNFFYEVDAVLAALSSLPPLTDGTRAAHVAGQVMPARFEPRAGVAAFTLFGFDTEIAVGDLPVPQAQALCWSAISAHLILQRLVTPLEGAAIARLGRLTKSWSNYRAYGYTRQPLEMLLWPGNARDSLPRRWQWVFAHLSGGMELQGSRLDSVNAVNAIVLEFGGLLYRQDFTQYSGASLIVTAPPGRPVAIGGMAHIARGLRGGVVFRRDAGTTKRSFVISSDLYGLLDRSKKDAEDGLTVARGLAILPGWNNR